MESPLSSIGRRRQQARSDPSRGYSERRDLLLQAAGRVFKEKGFEAASINDIATEAGTDRASVYYYYRGKDEIFLDLVRTVVHGFVNSAENIATGGGSATVRLSQLFEAMFDFYETHYPYQYVYLQEDLTRFKSTDSPARASLMELHKRYEKTVESISSEGIESGEFRSDIDPQMLTLAVLGAANWSHRWFKPGGRLEGKQIGRSFADIFIHGAKPRG